MVHINEITQALLRDFFTLVKPITAVQECRNFLVPGREGECVVSMEIGRIMMFGLFSAVMVTSSLLTNSMTTLKRSRV
jgi:hypothetical protein